MTSELKVYLKKVCFFLKKKNRTAVYKELRMHFQNQIEDLQKKGFNQAEAIQQILKTQTNPYVLGYKMRRAQMSFLRRHFLELSLASIFVGVLLLFQYIDLVIQKEILPKLDQVVIAEENKRLFENDLKFLSKKNELAFLETSRSKNAAQWVYSEQSNKLSGNQTKEIDTLEKLFRQIKNTDLSNIDKVHEQIFAVKTDWLEEIHQFDYLDHLTDSDYQRLLDPQLSMVAKIGIHASTKWPNYLRPLKTYSVHRTLQMCLHGQCLQGLKSLRKIAVIINSTQTLLGQVMAMSLLRQESFFVEKFKVRNYSPIEPEVLNAYERVSWGWKVILGESLAKQSISERWQSYLKPQLGLCASLVETPFGYMNSLSDFLEKRWAFESDFSERMQKEKNLLKSLNPKCHLQFYSKLMESNAIELNIIDSKNQFGWILQNFNLEKIDWINLAAIPYVRNYVGLRLINIFAGSSWGIYTRLPPKI